MARQLLSGGGMGLLLFLGLSSAAAAQSLVARLSAATGQVSVRHGQSWAAVTAAPVDLYDGDKVATERGRAEVRYLGDGSTLVLDVGSNVTVNAPQAAAGGETLRRVEIYLGDVWFKMTKSLHQQTDLVTPTAVGGLRGTEGWVHVRNQKDSSFSLNEGQLEIAWRGAPKGSSPMHLFAHQECTAKWGKPMRMKKHASVPVVPLNVPEAQLPKPKTKMRDLPAADRPDAKVGRPSRAGGKPGKPAKPAKPQKSSRRSVARPVKRAH